MNLSRIFLQDNPPFNLTYLNDLAEAVIRVDESYCNWEARHIVLQKSERVFAYELYHQLKLLTIGHSRYDNVRFDGEIGKQISQHAHNCGYNINTNQLDYSPDLVLHKSQTDNQTNNQKLIVEIKARNVTDDDMAKDIIKLNHYISALNFQYAIFISANTNIVTIKQKLKRIYPLPTNPILINNFKQLIIFNYKDRTLIAMRLYDLLAE